MREKFNKIDKRNIGILLALTSALLYAFDIVAERTYIDKLSSDNILFLMYLGAGVGLLIIHLLTRTKTDIQNKITKKEVPKIIIIVICELIGSMLLIESLKKMDASLVSLLTIFEIVMTSFCAYYIFKEPISKKEVLAIIFVFAGGVVLNFQGDFLKGIGFGSMLVIAACFCWGIANNVTASISKKEPAFFSSIKCLSVALLYFILMIIKNDLTINHPILLLFGFISFGLGILAYALSTRHLGASKATLVFSFCPLFGAIYSFIIFKEVLTPTFVISAILMIIGILVMNYHEK